MHCSLQNVIYLDINECQYNSAKLLGYNRYSWKNVGYLYAIQHGARMIYNTENDIQFNGELINKFITANTSSGIFWNGTGKRVFNQYSHFGQPSVWPQGYPMDDIASTDQGNLYVLCEMKTPSIQQGLVGSVPDVDDIFQPTYKDKSNVQFGNSAPGVALPSGMFAPLNLQNTLFLYQAFWAMLPPVTATDRVSDIWRGYWAQRLLWEIGDTLAFFSPRQRAAHSFVHDSKEEKALYQKAGELVSFLRSWRCGSVNSFFSCAIQLSKDMVVAGYWKDEDALICQLWVEDLIELGYNEPRIVQRISPCLNQHSFLPVQYTPDIQTLRVSGSHFNQFSTSRDVRIEKQVEILCPNLPHPDNSRLDYKSFSDLLLIIVFNHPHYGNVKLLEELYRPYFSNILYCGSNFDDFRAHHDTVSFVEAIDDGGYFFYDCMRAAIGMQYGVNGYLLIPDDILFNFWNIGHLDRNKIWFTWREVVKQNRYLSKDLWWWQQESGRQAVDNAWIELQHKDHVNYVKKFIDHLSMNLGGSEYVVWYTSDVFYLPSHLSENFASLASIFSKHRVFVEITVPTILFGLTESAEMVELNGKYLWNEDRINKTAYYNSGLHFLHPFKYDSDFQIKEHRDLFCTQYLHNFPHQT